jgi:dipeptidyl aminopeptidase/acylaminoacyl peptidase
MTRARRQVCPYGLWPSPIRPADVAIGARRFGLVQGAGGAVYWTESRPQEKGRQALLRRRLPAGPVEELLPAPWSARSRVHEYGGGEFLVAGDRVYFVNDADQDIYELVPGKRPRRLTREPEFRFADLCLDHARGRLIAVAEWHRKKAGRPDNLLVTIALTGRSRGALTPLIGGHDFFAAPCVSPDGGKIAFMAWNLPDMPWDQSEVLLARLAADGAVVGGPVRVAGGRGVAASHPAYAPDGTLIFVTDERDEGRIALHKDGKTRIPVQPRRDFGRPMWTLGARPYAVVAGERIAAASIATGSAGADAAAALCEVALGTGRAATYLGLPQLDGLSPIDDGFVAVESSAAAGTQLVAYRLTPRGPRPAGTIRPARDEPGVFEGFAPRPEPVTFKGEDGAKVRAFYYAPTSPLAEGPPGSRPPALVLAHGGPTSMASRALTPRIAFYTSRGFAVLDVDYAGSTGYGRAYRARLDGKWGIADVADCAAGARFLAERKLADPTRIAIAGGSAGGYTTLMALATTDAFAAGSSHYGISDLALLMQHTHKFESGYLHRLLGTNPTAWRSVCRARSPIHLVDRIRSPLILFQGLDDKVVPPEQSRLIAETLKRKGRTVELHEFAGEGHGFRRAETISAVLEAECAFLLRALRITD